VKLVIVIDTTNNPASMLMWGLFVVPKKRTRSKSVMCVHSVPKELYLKANMCALSSKRGTHAAKLRY
jgi:hypothetical protein